MSNPTGWKPSMEKDAKDAKGHGLDGGTGAGGSTRGIVHEEPLLFERGSTGRTGVSLPPVPPGHDAGDLPAALRRDGVDGLPEISELEVVRHFTRMSIWNHGIDTGFYPLGSCTMKYNPKSSEALARLAGFANRARGRSSSCGTSSGRSRRSPGSTRRRCLPRRARTASSAGSW